MKGATPCGPRVEITKRAVANAMPSGTGRARASRSFRTSAGPRGKNWAPSPTAIVSTTSGVTRSVGVSHPVTSRPSRYERGIDRVGPEEHPPEAHEIEGGEPLEPSRHLRVRWFREHAGPAALALPLTDREEPAVEAPHTHEVPRGAVPQPAEHHRDHQVHVGATPALAAAAERDVQVVAEPPRQRHVPPTPELLDRRRACTADRSSAGSGTRAAARCRSRCRCSR